MEGGEGGFRPTEATHQAPRVTEIPQRVEVSGFGEREAFVRRMVESVGLPLNNVSRITFRETSAQDTINSGVLGSVHMETGELSFYKRMEGLPEIAQLGVATHELSHENDPYDKKNVGLYGSEERMAKTAENVKTVSEQTKESRVYMNWYHKFLLGQLEDGKIDEARFLSETHAIMIELRYTNPKHLEEVLKSQNEGTATQIMTELDNTLRSCMLHLKDKGELDTHIKNLKIAYQPKAQFNSNL